MEHFNIKEGKNISSLFIFRKTTFYTQILIFHLQLFFFLFILILKKFSPWSKEIPN